MNRNPCGLSKRVNQLEKSDASPAVAPTKLGAASICQAAKSAKLANLANLVRSARLARKSPAKSLLGVAVCVTVSTLLALTFTANQKACSCNCGEVKIPSPAPENFGRAAGEKFYNSPQYNREFVKAIADARAFCTKFKKEHEKVKLAIVSDIDETILNNEPMLKNHEKIDSDAFWSWIGTSKAPKLRRTTDFLAWARKNGFSIFLVTGRHEKYRLHTIVNLREQGVAYDGLYLRPDDQSGAAEGYKTEVRQSIEKMGFTIAENIGDQFSDLAGGHSADCAKLPNQFYFIP